MSAERKLDRMRPLTKLEIDRQIDILLAQVASDERGSEGRPADDPSPRWIRPAELVRRMSPYIVYN